MNCVEEVEIFSVLIGLEIEVIEQFNKSFVELSDFDVAWTRFNLALNNCNLPVLVSEQLLLSNQLFILLFKLLINLMKSGTLFILLNF